MTSATSSSTHLVHRHPVIRRWTAIATCALLLAGGAALTGEQPEAANAAPGDAASLYVGASEPGTAIGNSKTSSSVECPVDSVVTGVRTENRVGTSGPGGILTKFDIQCSRVTTTAQGAVTTIVQPAWYSGGNYDESRGNLETVTCPVGTVAHRIGATTFAPNNWLSQASITCRPLVLQADGAIRIDLAATPSVLTSGTNFNTDGAKTVAPQQCGPADATGTSSRLVRGYLSQPGGEGIDGMVPLCTGVPRDFGDAPSSYGSASHELNAATYLGSSADAETRQQSNGKAAGDDAVGGTSTNRTIDDEDGVAAFAPLLAGADGYSVDVVASNKSAVDSTLAGWIDFDRDGSFDAGEGASVPVPAHTPDGTSFTVSWTGLSDRSVPGASFARFRVGPGVSTSTPSGNGTVGEVEDFAVPITAGSPGLTLDKTVSPATVAAAGDRVEYSFAVTNTGDVRVTDVAIDEKSFGGSGELGAISCPTTTLEVGLTTTCTATYIATDADVDAGSVSNSAVATGTAAGATTPVVSSPSNAMFTATASPEISLVKSSDAGRFTAAGQKIGYTFTATNTGNMTLSGLTVEETLFTGSGTAPSVTCPAGAERVAPGAAVVCSASYTTTQADVDAGHVTNTAVASASQGASKPPVVSPASTVAIPASSAPGLTIVKSADRTEVSAPGQKIGYSFVLTNEGNVTLSNASVKEGAFSGSGDLSEVTCPASASAIAPGASVTCTASYTVTQADIDAGRLTNTAIATAATDSSTTPVVAPASTVVIPASSAPALSLVKSADRTEVSAPGQKIGYSFAVANTGNVTILNVGVVEGDFTGSGDLSKLSCPAAAASLTPGASVTCTATYDTEQDDIDRGSIVNTATAGGTVAGELVASNASNASVGVAKVSELDVAASVNPTFVSAVGTTVDYGFDVTNRGNTTLSDVRVEPTLFTGSGRLSAISCPAGAASLTPGATLHCTASYTATQADIDGGTITTAVIATSTSPDVASAPAVVDVTTVHEPEIDIVTSVDTSVVHEAGERVTFSFLVANNGNVTLTDTAVVVDGFDGSDELDTNDCLTVSLAPGDSTTCSVAYTATQADVDAGSITLTAVSAGLAPGAGEPTISEPSSATVDVLASSGLALTKTATATDVDRDGIIDEGDRIDWSITATNTGTTTLVDLEVDDPTAGAVSCQATSLAPGDETTCRVAPHTVTAEDARKGRVVNVATADAKTIGGERVEQATATAVTPVETVPAPVVTPVAKVLAFTGADPGPVVAAAAGLLLLGALLVPVAFSRRKRAR